MTIPAIQSMFQAVFTCFSPYLGIGSGGGGGGAPKGLVHNLLMQFFPLDSSKMEVFKKNFDILTTHYDHPSYLKHISGRIYMFFTLFGYWVGGGGSQGIGTQSAYAVFHPGQLKNGSFQKLFF